MIRRLICLSMVIGLCLYGQAMAQEIAANAPLAVRASKRMMRMGLEESFETHVQHVYLQLLPLFASDDFDVSRT